MAVVSPSLYDPNAAYYGYSPYYSVPPAGQSQDTSGSGGSFTDLGVFKPSFGDFSSGIKGAVDKFGTGLGFSGGTVGNAALFNAPAGAGAVAPGIFGTPGLSAATGGAFNSSAVAAGVTPASAVPGTAGLTGTLSGTLGAAGLGALAGGYLGKIGGSQLGGTIGGALGAGAGMSGALAAFGLAGGPVGAIVGGLIGGLGGGFFGNKKKPTSASEFTGITTPTGGFKNSEFAQKNGDIGIAQGISSEFSQYLSSASKNLGVQFKPLKVYGGYNTLYGGPGGGFLEVNGTRWNFDPNDPKSKSTAYSQAIQYMGKASGAGDLTAKMEALQATKSKTGSSVPTVGAKVTPAATQSSFSDAVAKYNTMYKKT